MYMQGTCMELHNFRGSLYITIGALLEMGLSTINVINGVVIVLNVNTISIHYKTS